jgi:dTDP-4-amino-4,6-dideoxygalactose transaminase
MAAAPAAEGGTVMQAVSEVVAVPFVDLKAQYAAIKREIDQAIAAVIAETAFVGGPFLKEFEEAFARYCGVDHCVGVANGTDAIAMALRVLGVGPGDEVITAANSFIATSEAIRMVGAKVVFVDIDAGTYNIDVTQVERKITSRTKAIVPVHLYGQPADLDPITALARSYRLKVVGDAAQAHGAKYKGRPVSTLADITCFSFYPGKNLGAYGDAGALVTNNAEWAAQARLVANHGRTSKYDHELEGINSRLDGVQAAILNAKLAHLDDWVERRRAHAACYNRLLQGLPVTTPKELPEVRAVYHLYVVRVAADRREQIQARLKAAGVETGIHYPIALPYLKAYHRLGHQPGDFPVALAASREILSLPMFPELTDAQMQHVASRLREALA